MTIDCTLHIGDLIAGAVSLVAIIAATIVGVSQIKINRDMLKIQDHYDLFARVIQITKKDGDKSQIEIPAISIQNLSATTVYLENYSFNGRIYPVIQSPLPPVSCIPDYMYYIELPRDGQTHVSLELFYTDSLNRKWVLEGFFDLDIDWIWNLNKAKMV